MIVTRDPNVRYSLVLSLSFFFIIMGFIKNVQAEVIFIANKSVGAERLSKDDINKIFLGKKIQWDDNQSIQIVTFKQTTTSAVHTEFVKTYASKTTEQFRNYWKQMMFTGQASLPKAFDSEKEIIDHVKATEGSIGYISSGTKPEGVKIITITD